MQRGHRYSLMILGCLICGVAGVLVLFPPGGGRGREVTVSPAPPPPETPETEGTQDPGVPPAPSPAQSEAAAVPAPADLHLEVETLAWLPDPSAAGPLWLGTREVAADARGEFHLFRHGAPAAAGSVSFVKGPSEGMAFVQEEDSVVRASGLVPGRHQVAVAVEDLPVFHRLIRLGRASEPFAMDWRRGGALVCRVVTEEGAPVADAEVWADGPAGRTDEEGLLRVEGRVPGWGSPLRVLAPGRMAVERVVEFPRAGEVPLTVRLPAGASVRGRVLAPEGTAGQARLFVLPGPGTASSLERSFPFHLRGVYADVEVAADGLFRLDGLPSGVPLRLLARHPLFPHTRPLELRLREDGRLPVQVLVPVEADLVEGTVHDAAGEPVAGAAVTARVHGTAGRRPDTAGVPDLLFAPDALDAHLLAAPVLRLHESRAWTGEDGRFAVGRPGRGPWILEARAAGRLPAAVEVRRRGPLVRDLVLPEPPAAGTAPTGVLPSGAVLALVFEGVEAGASLRVSVERDGRRDAASFRWDPRSPLRIPLGAPAWIRVSARFEREGRELSHTVHEAAVLGEARVALPLPRGH